jgi:hypothetical protein
MKPVIFAQQATLPTNVVWQTGLPVAPAPAEPVVFEAQADPIELPHGGEAKVAVKVARPSGADAAIDLATLTLPPGLTVPAAKIAEKAPEAVATIQCTPETPLGLMTIAFTGKGKFGDKNWTFAVPGVTLNVVRPVSLELAASAMEVKAGATFELKGKVARKGSFKEPVTVKINGLPAGLKADPVTVAPEGSEFTVKVVAEPAAAAATANVQVAAAFQLNKKDYPSPTVPLAVKVVPAN